MWNKFILFMVNNWLYLCGVAILILIILWVVGYFANAVYGLKFDLSSVWVGVGVLAGTAVTGFGGQLAKYYIDSKHNTLVGEMPNSGEVVKNG